MECEKIGKFSIKWNGKSNLIVTSRMCGSLLGSIKAYLVVWENWINGICQFWMKLNIECKNDLNDLYLVVKNSNWMFMIEFFLFMWMSIERVVIVVVKSKMNENQVGN